MSWLTYQKAFGKPILHSLPSSKGAFVKVACADQWRWRFLSGL